MLELLSASAGLPTWRDLSEQLIQRAEADAQRDPDGEGTLRRLEAIRGHSDEWVVLEVLRELLGGASFTAAVREALAGADTCAVPPACRHLWRLPIGGMLTLNLDRLATRGFAESGRKGTIIEFNGFQAGHFVHVLKSPSPFLANLHGTVSDVSSWVLTKSQLVALQENPGYRQLLNTCASARTLLFVGISADDLAAGSFLADLRRHDIDFGHHFWLTDRTDQATKRWAEEAGIRTIVYDPSSDHHEVAEFVGDLLTYVPTDDLAPPVEPVASESRPVLPPLDDLLRQPADEIRELLNAHAMALLCGERPDYDAYEVFCREYDQAIYRAWYVSTKPPDNQLLGYELDEQIAHGAFGRVYSANKEGSQVAVKVLREEVRRDPRMLQSFRRGVRSMNILSRHNVSGMVAYRQAAEIPAFVVMDYVDGPNLHVAVESQYITGWDDILRIAADLTSIIRAAHSVPERVLHRDIRPSNIMLKGYYHDPSDWEVVVLDFDLSWHRGAMEVSVVTQSSYSGFLAPEQVRRVPNVSTRSAAVDSYGIGMTLYYMRTCKEPFFAQHQHTDWHRQLEEDIARHRCSKWRSLPRRYARLIEHATLHRQPDRWDLTQIAGEIERLRSTLTDQPVCSAELVAEELVAQAGLEYSWDADRLSAEVNLAGLQLKVSAGESDACVILSFEWASTGVYEHRSLSKYISKAIAQSCACLRKGGWAIEAAVPSGESAILRASQSVRAILKTMKDNAEAVKRSMRCFDFR